MRQTIKIISFLFIIYSITAGISPREIFEQNRQAICLVTFYQNIASDSRIGSFDKIKRNRIGIIVGSDGLIMVNGDVYPVSLDVMSAGEGSFLSARPTDFKVTLADGREFPAQFLGKDDQAEVAFIRLEGLPEDSALTPVSFIPTPHLNVGDTLFILELLPESYQFQPLFTPHQLNAIVEQPRRKFLINNYSTALSAGGLVLDNKGDAVGITLKSSLDFSFQPPQDFEEFHKDFLEIAPSEWFAHLIHNPPVLNEQQISQKSWLGIQMQGLSSGLAELWKVPQGFGVVVREVFPESPAEKAGLQEGDVILSVDDSLLRVQKDEETARLRNIIREIPPGRMVKFRIFRKGKIFLKNVRLEAAPKAINVAENYLIPELGFEVRELTRDVLYERDLPLSTEGVFTYQVDRASPAGLAGLRIGDIIQELNGQPVRNLETARTLFSKALENTGRKIMLKVREDHSTRFVFIDLKK
ncbi:MAG: hypothetical protein Kow0042_29700 [Calditrichia bacterium]